METNQGNKLIAEFMGIELFGKDKNYTEALLICSALNLFVNPLIHFKHISEIINVDNFKFDSSWDWLMPVVEKIEEMNEYYIFRKETAGYFEKDDLINAKFIQITWGNVIEFIKWYNLNKKK